ncbi:WhiB family transcriptional regulator [Streptomyces alboflavus]|uniref:WhiB family transcriptional regulator n=1 Tax=Streptomyces alboflavus TaxID=67267 RepID=UPI0004BFD63A|nr:WhiB family transcriptional regulator [Streptomyces alboflavus]
MSRPSRYAPDTLPGRGQWIHQAACVGQWSAMDDETPAGVTYAKQICRSCPVRMACLDDALRTGDVKHGVRGGLGWRRRQRLAAMRRKAAGSTP